MPDTIFKRVGGKVKIRKWIASHLPAHKVYCEPFSGSFAVGMIMPKPSSNYRLVLNDTDDLVCSLFRSVRDHKEEFIEKVKYTPYSRAEFDKANRLIETGEYRDLPDLDKARLYLIYNRQSFSGKEDGSWSISRKGENNCLTWSGVGKLIDGVCNHLKGAYIECSDYRDVVRRWDSPETLFYVDPPYEGVEKDYYKANKEEGFDHEEMAKVFNAVEGSVAVSYYDSEYVRNLYPDFMVCSKEVYKHMQTGDKSKATEILLVKESEWAMQNRPLDMFE